MVFQVSTGKIIKALFHTDNKNPINEIKINMLAMETGSQLVPNVTCGEYQGIYLIIRDDLKDITMDGKKVSLPVNTLIKMAFDNILEDIENIMHDVNSSTGHESECIDVTDAINIFCKNLQKEVAEMGDEYDQYVIRKSGLITNDTIQSFYGLTLALDEYGIKIQDIKSENVGIDSKGRLKIRDMLRFQIHDNISLHLAHNIHSIGRDSYENCLT